MPCRAHSSVIVHSCDNHCFINSLRFFTTPLTFQGMLLCSRLRRTDQTVNHLPGLLCQLCPQSGPTSSHGSPRWLHSYSSSRLVASSFVSPHRPKFLVSRTHFQPHTFQA